MKSKNSKISRMFIVAMLVFSVSIATFAGGFKIQDQSTRAMGMIDAFVAGADDASAVYYNPAGLTNVGRPQIIGNLYIAHATVDYDGGAGDDSSDGRVYVVPSGYFAMPLDPELGLYAGIGVYSPFGLGSRWGDDTPQATMATANGASSLAEIRLVNINPSIAWKVTDKLSVGGGVNYYKSQVINRYIDNLLTNGEIDIDAKGDGWGYNLGIQYQATEAVALGLTYRSPVTIAYEGDVELDGLNMSMDADSEIDFPAMIAGGVSWQATTKLRLELAAEWQKWSTRDSQIINYDVPVPLLGILPTTQNTEMDWEDTWVLMLGAEYELNEKWTLRGGYAYNETPVPDK